MLIQSIARRLFLYKSIYSADKLVLPSGQKSAFRERGYFELFYAGRPRSLFATTGGHGSGRYYKQQGPDKCCRQTTAKDHTGSGCRWQRLSGVQKVVLL